MSVPSDLPLRARRSAVRLALGIGLLYVLAGAAWVLTSDAIVEAISSDAAWRQAVQSEKGVAYVLLTGLGLVALVYFGTMRLFKAHALARSHELQIEDLFVANPVPMWIYEPQTLQVLRVNQAAVASYGWSADEFRTMKVSALDAPPGAAPPAREPGVHRHATKFGQPIYALLSEHRVPFEGRIAVLAMAVDVTRNVQAQQEIERQESRFRQLHQSLGEVLWLADAASRRILYLSPAFETVYGRARADFLTNPQLWLDVVHEDDRAIAAASGQALALDGASSCEYRIRHPDGSIRWVADRKKTIVDDDGQVSLIAGIGEDITDRKQLQLERANSHAELERRVVERTAELERVNAELDAFTRTAAHDLKSPLNAVAGFGELLAMRHGPTLGADGQRLTRGIVDAARQMAGLVNDLMSLSVATTAALTLSEVDLVPLAREVLDDLRRAEPQRTVEFDAPAELRLWCDRGLARSLLANLIGNAWKFTGQRPVGRIRLAAVRADEGATVVHIEDNGAGFDASRATHLFEPFQRYHAAGQFAGTGVGLATCRRIVQRHGGEISLDSAPDRGTVVCFSMPMPATAVGANPGTVPDAAASAAPARASA